MDFEAEYYTFADFDPDISGQHDPTRRRKAGLGWSFPVFLGLSHEID